MDISKINQNFSEAIKEVDKAGMIKIEKYGKPAYVFMTHDFFKNLNTYFNGINMDGSTEGEQHHIVNSYTLHEAMKLVLLEQPERTMRYTNLANAIWKRGLYRQSNGKKAPSSQILLRAKNYGTMFSVGGEGNHYITLILFPLDEMRISD